MKRLSYLLFVFALTCDKPAAHAPGAHAGHDAAPMPATGHEGHVAAAVAPGAIPEGYAEVQLEADRVQMIGLRTTKVQSAQVGGIVRATATIVADEKRVAHVHSKLMGWVQDLYVNSVGQTVKKGQALYTIYSQDLLVAQQEYLRARQFSPELAAAARDRLSLWDVPADQIAEIERKGEPIKAVTVRAPIAGTVLEKAIVKGHYVEPDMMLYLIGDLSRVWVVAEIYEFELGRVDRKAEVKILVEGRAEPIAGRIDYVYPTMDATTRTVRLRVVVDNKDGTLRPGNFATMELPAVQGEAGLVVPEEAVIDTGLRQVVFVALGEGRFRPVDVHVGRRSGGQVEILHGLAADDQVVVSAQFLLDSESRLRGSAGPAAGHGGH
jgi:Cu(I)/Ag(I) efflux system membrane fusion protein